LIKINSLRRTFTLPKTAHLANWQASLALYFAFVRRFRRRRDIQKPFGIAKRRLQLRLLSRGHHERMVSGAKVGYRELCLPLSDEGEEVHSLLFASYQVRH